MVMVNKVSKLEIINGNLVIGNDSSGILSFVSVLFLYYQKYTGALISNVVSTISIIFDNVINSFNLIIGLE